MITLEYYNDLSPESQVYGCFDLRMEERRFSDEGYATIAFDSATSMALASRRYSEYLNPKWRARPGSESGEKAYLKRYGAVTDYLEEALVTRVSGLQMNVVTLAHVAKEKNAINGEIVKHPAAPGRLADKGQMLASFYSEVYYAYVMKGQGGELLYCLQTQNDGQMYAKSQIQAPNPCFAEYGALWENWGPAARPPIHCLVYGDPGCGKTTFLTSFEPAGDVLVFYFDAMGMDMPYLRWAAERGYTVKEDYDERNIRRVHLGA